MLRQYDADAAERVLRRMPVEARLIHEQATLDWVPVEIDRHLPGAIIEELGRDAAVAFFRWMLPLHTQLPLLRSTLTATFRLFGISPAALVRATPLAWGIVYRDFCSLGADTSGAGKASLQLRNVAPEVIEAGVYAITFEGIFAGYYDLCNTDGTVDVRVDAESRAIDIALAWPPKS